MSLRPNSHSAPLAHAISAGVACLLWVMQSPAGEVIEKTSDKSTTQCLAEGGGFLRARLSGAINSEISWGNENTECTGATRPSGGVRIRFGHDFGKTSTGGVIRLVLLFGIPGLREGVPARDLPVNLTIIREGVGEFFGTRGDDKCTIEKLEQLAIAGIPLRNRSYRVTARGFCTLPARAVAGDGVVLVSRFDFTGRVDYSEEDRAPDTPVLAQKP